MAEGDSDAKVLLLREFNSDWWMNFRIELSRKASRMADKMTFVPSSVVRAFFLAIEKIEALFGEFGNPGRKILRKWSTLSSNSHGSVLGLGVVCSCLRYLKSKGKSCSIHPLPFVQRPRL